MAIYFPFIYLYKLFIPLKSQLWNISLCVCVYQSESCSVMSNSLQPHELYSLWNSPDQNIRVPFPSPGHLPNPGIEPGSPASQAGSLPADPQGKPKNTGVGSLSLLQGIFLNQGSNRGLLHCRWILYQLSYQWSVCVYIYIYIYIYI